MNLMRMFQTAMMFAGEPVTVLLFRLMILREQRRRVGPFDVVVLCRKDMTASLIKLADAAKLVQTHDIRRYRRLVEALRLVVVVDSHMDEEAQYHRHAHGVLLRADALEVLWVESLAAVLVHEATHAAIENRGIRYFPFLRRRIERLCVRNEIWFLDRVPGAEALAEVKRESLIAPDE